MIPSSKKHRVPNGFSLIELLAVLSIALILLALSGLSIGSLGQSGEINKAAGDLSGVLEFARSHAMSKQTYVRVALCDVSEGGSIPGGGTVVFSIASADGTLIGSTTADMSDSVKWPALGRPLVLRNMAVQDFINVSSPDTRLDSLPSASDLTAGSPLQRTVPGFGTLSFRSFVQFEPDGQARVMKDKPARQIKIALDRRGTQGGKNPVLLRLSGNNGGITVFRAESEAR